MFLNLRFAARTLRRNPGFTTLAVVTIALGIGVNTAVFSVVNGVLLRPLAFNDPERLVKFTEIKGPRRYDISYPNYRDWQRRALSFQAMAIYNSYSSVTFKGPQGNEILPAADASRNIFQTLGVRPVLGRDFIPDDDKGDGAPVAVITNEVWIDHFGKDPAIVGRPVALAEGNVTIIGVLPPSFHLSSAGLWFPMGTVRNPFQLDRGNHPGFAAIARLKPGVTIDRARSEMSAIAASLAHDYPATNKEFGVQVTEMFDAVVGRVRPTLLILFGAVGFVLLIASVNVANLLLARTIQRDREVAVRTSLGAGRMHVIGMMLSESLLLSFAGTALGVLMAIWGVDVLLALQPDTLPPGRPIAMDGTVLLYSIFLMLLSTGIFALAPAWRAIRSDLSGGLRQGGRGTSAAKSSQRVRAALVSVEVALSIALLAGAGLMIRSLYALEHQEMGFTATNLAALQTRVSPQYQKSPQMMVQGAYTILDGLRAVPGVQSAAAIWPLPEAEIVWSPPINFEDRPREPGTEPIVDAAVVTTDYFKTMGIPLRQGRWFDAGDRRATSTAAVVNEPFAKRFYPGESVLGKQVVIAGDSHWKEIVGVVGDTRHGGLSGAGSPEIYWPFEVYGFQEPAFMVRTGSDAAKFIAPLRKLAQKADPGGVVLHAQTMDATLAGSVADRRFTQILLMIFAALAMVLAAIGIYGVVAFWVAQRTQEIGVRVALGARAENIFQLLFLQTMIPVGLGLAVGLVAAGMLTPYLASQIYGVTARDPWTLGAAAVLLGLVAAVASVLPARRALRIDPMVALRQE